jgi:hypothetical protein
MEKTIYHALQRRIWLVESSLPVPLLSVVPSKCSKPSPPLNTRVGVAAVGSGASCLFMEEHEPGATSSAPASTGVSKNGEDDHEDRIGLSALWRSRSLLPALLGCWALGFCSWCLLEIRLRQKEFLLGGPVSTDRRNRTCPVCPSGRPGQEKKHLEISARRFYAKCWRRQKRICSASLVSSKFSCILYLHVSDHWI